MGVTLAAMTLASSMILVDQTAAPLASPDAIEGLGGSVSQGQWLQLGGALGIAATFVTSAGIALLGALVSLLLVRHTDRVKTGPIFGRRSRWMLATQGRSSAITRRPVS